MNATPPEAKTQYSRGPELPGGGPSPDSARPTAPGRAGGGAIGAAVLGGGLLGAVLLVVAEFTTLFEVRSAGSSAVVKSVATGSHDTFALVPIALLAAAMAYGVWRSGSRPALLAIGVLGLLALLTALLGDLPDARASGLIGTATTNYVSASSRPSAGLYLETLGAVMLMITCGSGFLMVGGSRGRGPRPLGPLPPEPGGQSAPLSGS
jgi:hypothetical protein